MRRTVVTLMSTASGVVLVLSYHAGAEPSAAVGTGSTSSTGTAPGAQSSSGSTASGSFTGDAVMTRWGQVQVRITVQDGRITAAEAVQYPQDNPRDQEINAYALPVLAREVVDAQSASIDAVSGATVTSDGYAQSLQSAIDQARL